MFFRYTTKSGKVRELKSVIANDRTAEQLLMKGWKVRGNFFTGTWYDPQTGVGWAISQAAAIMADRISPKYFFKS